ncbi:hypothetical protein F5146DRAFT_1028400 [Armillaria mellea]|nr:hypothetical protein F5146DRAFT_1028400 [Armillaria mellea]
MSAPPGASNVSQAAPMAKKKPRLPRAGTSILNDFFVNVSHHPSREQQQVLLEQIQQFIDPTYDLAHLGDWFKRKRTSEKRPASNRSVVRIPLTPEQIGYLTTLYNANKNPTWEVLQTWSSLLKVKTTVVTDWIEEKNKLPISTPLSVPSPVFGFGPFKPEPPQSPARPALSPILPPAGLPPRSPGPLIITIPKRVPEADTYKAGFLEAFASRATSEEPTGPITREQLNELFKGPEADMKAFQAKVKRGELRHQGYTPAMANSRH